MFIVCRSPAPTNSRNDVIWPRQVSPDDHFFKNVFVMVTLLLAQSGTTGLMWVCGHWVCSLLWPVEKCRHLSLEGLTVAVLKGAMSLLHTCFFSPKKCSFDGGVRKALVTHMCCELTFWSLLRTHLILWIYIVQVISLTFTLKCNILKT